jgi:hypothetical protein
MKSRLCEVSLQHLSRLCSECDLISTMSSWDWLHGGPQDREARLFYSNKEMKGKLKLGLEREEENQLRVGIGCMCTH